MAQIKLTTHAQEEGTYVVTVSLTDSTGTAITPNSFSWSLYNMDGDIINSRDSVSISSPTSSEDIVLSGDDLIIENEDLGVEKRVLKIFGDYDSSVGNNLPIQEEITFFVDNLTYTT